MFNSIKRFTPTTVESGLVGHGTQGSHSDGKTWNSGKAFSVREF